MEAKRTSPDPYRTMMRCFLKAEPQARGSGGMVQLDRELVDV
jgi:hypothetical protein